MKAYYNEIDPYCCQWLRNLIDAGHIAPGDVDDRSIEDVTPGDVRGYTQCHWFAGIGGWSLAARLAGWPDGRPLWTASLPCQPFSVAAVAHGGGKGQDDHRHLLPHFIGIVAECRPTLILGEQVTNAIRWGWLDEAFASLESQSYACAAIVLPAIAVGARHERKRIYWMADADSEGWPRHQPIECFPCGAQPPLAEYGDPLAGAWRALDGDYTDLLPGDGIPIAMERLAAHAYGNAVVPQVAAQFIRAYLG